MVGFLLAGMPQSEWSLRWSEVDGGLVGEREEKVRLTSRRPYEGRNGRASCLQECRSWSWSVCCCGVSKMKVGWWAKRGAPDEQATLRGEWCASCLQECRRSFVLECQNTSIPFTPKSLSFVNTRKTYLLRKARISESGAVYFVTSVTKKRMTVLNQSDALSGVGRWLELCRSKNTAEVFGLILMPDHFHVLFKLGSQTSLSEVVRMLKFHIRNAIKDIEYEWQSSFFEHRIRDTEDLEAYARYLFLNPYRANLISLDQRWPFWVKNQVFRFSFETYLETLGSVPREWLKAFKNPWIEMESGRVD